MPKPKLTQLHIDIFDVEVGAIRGTTIEQLLAKANESGRESWAEFNGTMLKARPGDTADEVEADWRAAFGK